MATHKHIREILKDGRIIGHRHNNLLIGEAKGPRGERKALTPRTGGENDVEITVYLARREWGDKDLEPPAPDTGYYPLGDPQPTPVTPPPPPSTCDAHFPQYTVTVPPETPLMEVITQDLAGQIFMPNSVVFSNPLPSEGGEWFLGFTDTGNTADYNSKSTDENYDYENYPPYITWDGTDWMYFIGTPNHPIDTYNGEHGDAYPNDTLDVFTVANLPTEGDGSMSFTLSWEKMAFTFEPETTEENGEKVHRLVRVKARR
ncbi:MAG: hypothetical protein LBL83_09370 [Clostridiales bacterium]|nr:hypothetical protein [Clostridiales bacterium]